MEINDVLKTESNEKHLTIPDIPEDDALNNQPHHSVLIAKLGNQVVGLVNLFGSHESLKVIGDYNDNFKDWLGETGLVVISKSTANEVAKMIWEEYEHFKISAKNCLPNELNKSYERRKNSRFRNTIHFRLLCI